MTVLGTHPARLDQRVHPGQPIDFAVPVLDVDAATVDITGWDVAATAEAPDGTLLHTFTVGITANEIEVAATGAQTAAWAWPVYAARLVVTATPPGGGPVPITTGWIHLYKP